MCYSKRVICVFGGKRRGLNNEILPFISDDHCLLVLVIIIYCRCSEYYLFIVYNDWLTFNSFLFIWKNEWHKRGLIKNSRTAVSDWLCLNAAIFLSIEFLIEGGISPVQDRNQNISFWKHNEIKICLPIEMEFGNH